MSHLRKLILIDRCRFLQLCLATLVLTLLGKPACCQWSEQLAKLTPSDNSARGFGNSVAINGDRAIIGATGAAYVFDVITGEELAKYTLPFGSSDVDISDNTAIVGGGGAAIIDLATGEEPRRLNSSDATQPGLSFGSSVAINGDSALVGAYGSDHAGEFSGAAYVFDLADGKESLKLTASDASPLSLFGEAVALSGVNAVIIARDQAYVFDVTTGEELKKIAYEGYGDDEISVALSGNTAIVGGLEDFDPGDPPPNGTVTLLDISAGKVLFELTGPTESAFGIAVGIDDNTAIVGASDADDRAGQAYVFNTSTGSQIAKLTPDDATALDRFGESVGVSRERAIVGAPWEGDTGAAYLFRVVPEPNPCTLLSLGYVSFLLRRRRSKDVLEN